MVDSPTILIADDHPLILKGLKDFLIEKNHQVIAEATNGFEALNLIEAHEPDIVILDVQMPKLSGIDVSLELKKKQLKTKIILITFEKNLRILEQSRDAGVDGFILKEFTLDEIEKCIAAVNSDRAYFSAELLDLMHHSASNELIDELSKAEKNILKCLASNLTGKEIAAELSISVRTVEKHKSSIRQKLGMDSKPATLYLFAYRHLKSL